MELLLAFFTCFAFQMGSVYVSNILFVIFFVIKAVGLNKIKPYKNLIWFLAYICVVIVSTTFYALTVGDFATRNAVQLLYNVMYIFLAVEVQMDYSKFRCYYVSFSKLLSALICVFFVVLVASSGAHLMSDRLWAQAYIPGWPNGTALVLIFAYYLLYRIGYRFRDKCLVGVAMVLTTSRLALLGLLIITIYYELFARSDRKKYVKKFVAILVVGTGCLLVAWYVVNKSTEELDLVYMFTRVWDRMEIVEISIIYFAQRPLLGYGGNTLDVIMNQIGYLSNMSLNWPHSHSTLFELLLRYGIMGLLTFCGLAFTRIRYIKNKRDKWMYVFLWGCSLIQIYFRSFPFLMMLIYLLNNCDEPQEGKKDGIVMKRIHGRI